MDYKNLSHQRMAHFFSGSSKQKYDGNDVKHEADGKGTHWLWIPRFEVWPNNLGEKKKQTGERLCGEYI